MSALAFPALLACAAGVAASALATLNLWSADRILDDRGLWILASVFSGGLVGGFGAGVIAAPLGRRLGRALAWPLVTLAALGLAFLGALLVMAIPHAIGSYTIYTAGWRFRPWMMPFSVASTTIAMSGIFLPAIVGVGGVLVAALVATIALLRPVPPSPNASPTPPETRP